MLADSETRAAYMTAWDEWHEQVERLHRVLFEGETIRPEQLKGLLNREARKKEAYDSLRLRLLGLGNASSATAGREENPFKAGGPTGTNGPAGVGG